LEMYWNRRKNDREVLHDSSPVFRTHYRVGSVGIRPLTYSGISNAIYRLQECAGINKIRMGKRHDIQVDHGFRKFFETTLIDSGVDPSFAEMMMSHASKTHPSMPVYTKRTKRLFDEYKKAIPNLTIDDSERLKLQNQIKDETISKIESEKD